jgi:hypothetical protein
MPRGRPWARWQLALLRRRYADTDTGTLAGLLGVARRAVYERAQALGLRKSRAFLASEASGRLRRQDARIGLSTQFQPGQVPHNKGLRRPGWAVGRMRETQFKRGEPSRRWDPELYCVGALRITTDGNLEMKVRPGARAWVTLARWVWEQAHGPIPRGRVVRPVNGDPHDTRLDNLRLATRGELMRENTRHNLPPALNQVIGLRAALMRKINHRRRKHGEQDDQRPARETV